MVHRGGIAIVAAASLACGAAIAAKGGLRFENPPGMAAPVGAYSHVAIVSAGSELVVLAGQVGNDPSGALPSDPVAQFRNAMTNVLTALKAQGLGPQHIVKTNYWLVGDMPLDQIRAVRSEMLGDAKPPSTLAYIARLGNPDLRVEVEVWAARPPK